MILGLTYNLKKDVAVSPGDPIDRFEEFDSEETLLALEAALAGFGHTTHRLGWGPAMLQRLEELENAGTRIEGVFNFAEGIGGRGRESQVPATLEMLGIPFSGASPLSLGLTLDKALGKVVAESAGIATAPFAVAHSLGEVDGISLRYPLFAKPATEGSSMGITAASLCRRESDLRRTVASLLSAYGGAVLIEEFLPGDEFTVGIVGNGADVEIVGIMQVVPRAAEPDFIYSLEVKRDYLNRVDYLIPPPLSAAMKHQVESVALAVYRAFACRDVSRVDVRCDRDGIPNFVEVNPLPGMNPVSSDLVILARGMKWTYEGLIGRVIDSAIERWAREREPLLAERMDR
jgi:D-alanine-D-alanine ligase